MGLLPCCCSTCSSHVPRPAGEAGNAQRVHILPPAAPAHRHYRSCTTARCSCSWPSSAWPTSRSTARRRWEPGKLGVCGAAVRAVAGPTPCGCVPSGHACAQLHCHPTHPLLPQGVRSLCRFFLLFFLPVFFGPYWSWVHVQTNFAFAFFFSILVGALLFGLGGWLDGWVGGRVVWWVGGWVVGCGVSAKQVRRYAAQRGRFAVLKQRPLPLPCPAQLQIAVTGLVNATIALEGAAVCEPFGVVSESACCCQ